MMDFAGLIAQGEGQNTEFKKSFSLRRKALQALCDKVNIELDIGYKESTWPVNLRKLGTQGAGLHLA